MNIQRSFDCATAIVFGYLRKSEQNECAITLGSDDMPSVAFGNDVPNLADLLQNLVELLRFQGSSQAGRA